jgi:hypothetical protein
MDKEILNKPYPIWVNIWRAVRLAQEYDKIPFPVPILNPVPDGIQASLAGRGMLVMVHDTIGPSLAVFGLKNGICEAFRLYCVCMANPTKYHHEHQSPK